MTFEEALEDLDRLAVPYQIPEEAKDGYLLHSDVVDIVETLKQAYEPVVEMTRTQKENLLMMRNNQESLVGIMAEFDDGELINDFDSYWGNLTERKLVQAWLHPEAIRVIKDTVK